MATLLYHLTQDGKTAVSPFDEAILKVARCGPVRIVSPYIGVAYIERIIGISSEWRLISDVQEWLGSLSTQARPRAWQFIRENLESIHHCHAIHAKAVISDSLAMMGSANLTQHGILGRTEMGILLDDANLVSELGAWFDGLWAETKPPEVDEASAYIQWLDEEAAHAPTRRQRFALSSGSRKVRARLVNLEVKATTQPNEAPLNLSQVAQAIIIQDQKHYDSVEAAIEAAINKLTVGAFTFSQLAMETRRGFADTNLREIYILLVQHCANHVRSVFVDSTQNRLILKDGHFTQSTKETLWPALAPFDAFLVAIIGKLSFSTPAALPTEERLERETGIGGRDQVILVSELLDCGFLVLDDRPGELPYYTLDSLFDEWGGRFKLFPKAHSAWEVKQRQSARTTPQIDIDDDNFDIDTPASYGVLRSDQLPEIEDEDDDDIDFAGLEKVLRESEVRAAQRKLEHPTKRKGPATTPKKSHEPVKIAIPKPEVLERHQVDAFLARLLTSVAGGRLFTAQDWSALTQYVAQVTMTQEPIVRIALDPVAKHPKVFLVADQGGHCLLSINPMLRWDMLLSYPKTRAVCDKLLESA
ncbi:MAG TPA: phospholipase D-like domain-containing protein [Gallionella sp.]|nr:phospholipase D-like domain-containing protein [Gallionella sp.]